MIFCRVVFHARDPGSFNSHSSVPREHAVATRSIWLLDLKYNPEGYWQIMNSSSWPLGPGSSLPHVDLCEWTCVHEHGYACGSLA